MPNPFPGMNPYLEQPGLWPQVHNRLIVAIADEITPQVAPHYRVSIEEGVYTTTEALAFDLAIDYSQPLDPPLASEAAAWVKRCLESVG